MSLRRPSISWSVLSRSLHADRAAVVPGLVTARNRVAAFATFRKTPLVVAGQFNRSAIMAPADLCDQEIRLRVLAPMVIANGDKIETTDFARELMNFAKH